MANAFTNGHDIAQKVLAEEIVKMVLAETFLNESNLVPRVTAILKVYNKKANIPNPTLILIL
jgi:hypothetical protein